MTNELSVKGMGQGIIMIDTEGMTVLYETKGYRLLQEGTGQLFEERRNELEATTVWKLMMKSFKEEPGFYQHLHGWMPFLQRLQMTSHSVVNTMIAETRGFNEEQLKSWMEKRNDAELEEINFFGNSVAQFSLSALEKRGHFDGDDLEVEEEEDEDDEYPFN